MKNNTDIKPEKFEIGVIVARFQVNKLHEGHEKLINMVNKNHKKVIIFLGVPVVGNNKDNPLDFATRKAMLQYSYPNAVVLPLKDQRSDVTWSKMLDSDIKVPYGDLSAVLYGSRGSFIGHYKGGYDVIELTSDVVASGTDVRNAVSKEILQTEDFRAGIIHATYAARAVTYPTVDIVAYNNEGQLLMAKKPNETKYRFIGGFVDRTDESWEKAARREFSEETGGEIEIGDFNYVGSTSIKDWRYSNSESGIMTSLFIVEYLWGIIKPTDDIESLHWVSPMDVDVESEVMEEHKFLYYSLMDYLLKNKTIVNKIK